jgi:glycine/D-amino acid oxidase-like deaminating enzyme
MIVIIGAGLQGACLALELAGRGRPVTVIDAACAPMREASRWNEGKLHLGFVYANDPSFRSADAMMGASLAFLPTMERLLGRDLSHLVARSPFLYGVPRDSLVPVAAVAEHFNRVARGLAGHQARWPKIFGGQAWSPPMAIPADGIFAPESVEAAFATPEVALDTHALADLVAERLRDEPLVRLVTGVDVTAVRRTGSGFRLDFADGGSEDGFSWVVNASWRSLMRLDASLGHHPGRPWLYRYKAAVRAKSVAGAVPSCTFILGPYGDIVDVGDGRFYLSWYPACRLAVSDRADLPDMRVIDGGVKASIVAQTLQGLARLVPGLATIDWDPAIDVEGGWIFAWGSSDITDLGSGLHARHDVGASLDAGYVSLNTGKYCMAPLSGRLLSERIAGM